MTKNKMRGPLVTLVAVAALGGGLWWMNVSQETDAAAPPPPVVQTTVAPAPPRAPSALPPVSAFPAEASYLGKVPTQTGVITLEITVNDAVAVAYACDGNSIEAWLKGSAKDGARDFTTAPAGRYGYADGVRNR